MSIIGITGGFGTGKSFVASIFKSLGAKVVDADKLAHKALKVRSATYKKIVREFGSGILASDRSIDRRRLGSAVFGNKRKLAKLNRIIHPGVIREIAKRIKDSGGNEILIIDAPLICETSLTGLENVLVVVKASRENQLKRCVKKFKIKEEDVKKRVACQIPLEEKVCRADYVVDNNGTRKETEKQVKKIWQELKKGARVWR